MTASSGAYQSMLIRCLLLRESGSRRLAGAVKTHVISLTSSTYLDPTSARLCLWVQVLCCASSTSPVLSLVTRQQLLGGQLKCAVVPDIVSPRVAGLVEDQSTHSGWHAVLSTRVPSTLHSMIVRCSASLIAPTMICPTGSYPREKRATRPLLVRHHQIKRLPCRKLANSGQRGNRSERDI